MPETVQILRIKRSDGSPHLLLHVTQASISRPLDLKLVATEHEQLYHGNIKGSEVNKLRSDHFTGDVDELRDILCHVFLHTQPDGRSSDTYEGLELVATIQKDSATITVRKNIGGITQRVAAVKLIEDTMREEVQSFEWVDSAVAIADELRVALLRSQAASVAREAANADLQKLLDEMVEMKKQMEDDMLQKFLALLNSKKQRIRDLTKLLESRHVDVAQELDRIHKSQPRTKTAANGVKRKAAQDPDDDHDMDDAQEVDDESLEETMDEATDDDTVDARQATRLSSGEDEPAVHAKRAASHTVIPPPRELPFKSSHRNSTATSGQAGAAATKTHDNDDDDTEDEL